VVGKARLPCFPYDGKKGVKKRREGGVVSNTLKGKIVSPSLGSPAKQARTLKGSGKRGEGRERNACFITETDGGEGEFLGGARDIVVLCTLGSG